MTVGTPVRSARDIITSVHTYSPGINEFLVSKRPQQKANNIFGCGLEDTLIHGENLFKRRTSKVKVADGPVCKRWNSKEAIQFMLDNLRASENFDLSNVIAPQQIDSNCWFNTLFVSFFISDKGRKFFRFFRELMIRGEDVSGNKLPSEMAHAFFFLNACIEAAFNNKNVALAMNTNHVIVKIYDSVRRRDIKQLHERGLADVDEAGNPMEYYFALMDYIAPSHHVRFKTVSSPVEVETLWTSSFDDPKPPHLYAVELGFHIRSKVPIPTKFRVGRITYVLDSTVVMDTERKHFCSTLMCNGKEMGFDGASFSRLEDFKWKAFLNRNRKWTFKGSIFEEDENNKIWWNYQNSYVLLFYYRT